MEQSYTIPENERENVMKILTRLSKKADRYGQPLSYEAGKPYAKEINVFQTVNDYETGTSFQRMLGTRMVEAFDLVIDGSVISKEGYTVAAKIEHLDDGNIVYTVDGGESKAEWRTIKPRCEHCGVNHGQKITFIIRDEAGNEKQVGQTCLKDYCGIDPQRVGMLNQLGDMFLDLDINRYDFTSKPVPLAYRTLDVLALAIRIKRYFGYTPTSEGIDSNKSRLSRLVFGGERPTDRELEEAEAMSAAILSFKPTQTSETLNNVRTLLESGYCKNSHFGYIAYAPLDLERFQTKLAQIAEWNAEKDEERKSSEYVGKIGERITVDVAEINLITSWEGEWGLTYLYKIIDTCGNVLIWYASRTIEKARKIKATIKAHSERDGVKQTVVTRCQATA